MLDVHCLGACVPRSLHHRFQQAAVEAALSIVSRKVKTKHPSWPRLEVNPSRIRQLWLPFLGMSRIPILRNPTKRQILERVTLSTAAPIEHVSYLPTVYACTRLPAGHVPQSRCGCRSICSRKRSLKPRNRALAESCNCRFTIIPEAAVYPICQGYSDLISS